MIFKYENSLIDAEEINKYTNTNSVSDYNSILSQVFLEKDYLYNESSINLPGDKNQLSLIKKTLQDKISDDLTVILLIGIGGSSLGAKAVYDAILGEYDKLDDRNPKIIFAETNDPEYEEHLEQLIKNKVSDPKNILIFVVTKSGITKETILNKERIINILSKGFSFRNIKNRLVYITDKGTELWDEGGRKGIEILEIPQKIGGRFSVFSPVGVAPLLSVGIDVDELLVGATEMNTRCLSGEIKDNIALISAIIIFLQYKKGIYINDSFFFEMEMESLGKWYRQLLAESIGKKEDIAGRVVQTGITPTISIGTQDLHSILELNLGGPNDKFTTFISTSIKNEGEDNYKNAMNDAYQDVKNSYIKKSLPFTEVILPVLSEFYLGQYMQFKMLEIMYLGKLLGINPFIQPSVEKYKRDIKN